MNTQERINLKNFDKLGDMRQHTPMYVVHNDSLILNKNYMSLKENTDYLERMGERFDEYLVQGNIEQCRNVIEMLLQNNFQDEANGLLDELLNQPLEKFTNASPVFV